MKKGIDYSILERSKKVVNSCVTRDQLDVAINYVIGASKYFKIEHDYFGLYIPEDITDYFEKLIIDKKKELSYLLGERPNIPKPKIRCTSMAYLKHIN
jgi:hypothetical protein